MNDLINVSEKTGENPRKRVLFVITQSEMGGAQRFVRDLVTHLDKSRFDMTVAAGSGNSSKQQAVSSKYPLLDILEKENIKIHKLNYLQREIKPITDIKAYHELKKLIADWKPDVLFLNSSKAGVLGSLASHAVLRTPDSIVIYRIGGWSFNDPWPNWKKRLWKLIERTTARYKDIIIVNNAHNYEQAQKENIKPHQKLMLIHNGIDLNKLNFMEREEARMKFFENIGRSYGKIFNAQNLVCTIANLYPTKGLEHLIEAVRLLKYEVRNTKDETKFIIIGEGKERKRLERLIKEKGGEKDIFLVGALSEAYRYLKAFDAFVLPSVKEGFPWTILEAMAAKLPIIATRVGALPEIIEDGKNGILVPPAEPNKLAEALSMLLQNDVAKNELGIQAHQTILYKFEFSKMLREYEQLITQ